MRTRTILGAGAGVAAGGVLLGWPAWSTVAWLRYGRAASERPRDPLLDRFLPVYEVGESHAIRVRAPAQLTYAVAKSIGLERSAITRAIFRWRERLMRAERAPWPSGGIADQLLSTGWGILAERPGREIVFGAVTQPWRGNVQFRALAPDEFTTFDEPDYVKIVTTLSVEPRGAEASIFHTRTRAAATDAASRAHFRRYWAAFSPGILLIRRALVRVVKRETERRYRANRSPRVLPEAYRSPAWVAR